MRKLLHKKTFWLSLMVLAVIGLGLIYFAVQQSLRISANDPQISMAYDIAGKLASGTDENLASGHVDIKNDMAPFVMIFDTRGTLINGNAYLNDAMPVVPVGVLYHSKNNKVHAVTWQPETGVRIASVSLGTENGYILVGRNLYVTEKKIDTFGRYSLVAITALEIVLLAGLLTFARKNHSYHAVR